MDSKFYVSYEAARLLKEKGYNEAVGLYYNTLGALINVSDMFFRKVADNIQMAKYDYLSAPSKAEAIDWLESKGMCIIVFRRTIDNKVEWRYVVLGQTEFISGFKTRLEAEEAAIIKALELL